VNEANLFALVFWLVLVGLWAYFLRRLSVHVKRLKKVEAAQKMLASYFDRLQEHLGERGLSVESPNGTPEKRRGW